MRERTRDSWRLVMVALIWAAFASTLRAVSPLQTADSESVRLTLEIAWEQPTTPGLPELPENAQSAESRQFTEIEISAGRILEAREAGLRAGSGITIGRSYTPHPKVGSESSWMIGPGARGRVRVRVESPIGADLYVRAGGRRTRFPLRSLVDGALATAAGSPVAVRVERLAWDVVEFGDGVDAGIVEPNARLSVDVGFNVLSAEPAEVGLRYRAELRAVNGHQVVWRVEPKPEVFTTNAVERAWRTLMVPMPAAPGTYVLEVRADWEPVASLEGSALSRILKRKRGGPSGSSVRRTTLLVLGPARGTQGPTERAGTDFHADVVDQIDLTRPVAGRPIVAGRAPAPTAEGAGWDMPLEALVEPRLRDRLRGLIHRADEWALPPANATSVAYTAMELRTGRLGQAHRLTIVVDADAIEELSVALVAPASATARPRALLDASTSEPAHEPGSRTFSWLVWPDHDAPILLVTNRGKSGTVRLKSVELAEAVEGLPRAPSLAVEGKETRRFALQFTAPGALERLGASVEGGALLDRRVLATNLRDYVAFCGATAVVLPAELADASRRRWLDGQYEEDALAPDTLETVFRVIGDEPIGVVLEVDGSAPLDGLPAPASDEARELGLARLDARGQAHDGAYQLLRPEVRGALKRRLQAVIEPRGRHGNLSGVLIKLGSGFTVLGPIATGLDDWTYLEFVKAKFPARESSLIPGLDIGDGGRFEARARFVTGVGRSAWLEWRADRLGAIYAELAAVVTEAAPGGCLVLVTPTPEDGVAAEEARQSDQRGEPPDAAWLALGLDLKRWPADVPGLAVLRGVSLGGDELAQELATSPELDQAIHAQSVRGAWVGGERRTDFGDAPGGSRLDARPARIDVPLGHAMAVLDPSWVVVDASVVAGSEGLLTRFCRVFHALPPARSAPAPPLPSGVALRSYEGADGTYVSIANDSPYEVLQAALLSAPAGTTVDDVGRHVRFEPTPVQDGGQSLVLRLPPFGVTTLRIGASLVVVQPGTSYLPALAALESQADGLSARLVNSEALIGPPSPGFEPQRPRPHAAGPGMMQVGAPDAALAFDGWHAGDIALGEVQADASNPHSGSRALRLAAAGPSASAACDEFLPPGGTSLSIQTWLRSDRPDCRVRVHIEGQSRGVSIARHADVPAGPEWSERIVRVPELPAEGLDWMRLRYEWLEAEPGKLWIDDVAVNGQGASESGKRAHRVLLEALQAYRARRFAEFARLMGSRRARHAVPNLGVIEPSTIRTGQASDLPANRRLR